MSKWNKGRGEGRGGGELESMKWREDEVGKSADKEGRLE